MKSRMPARACFCRKAKAGAGRQAAFNLHSLWGADDSGGFMPSKPPAGSTGVTVVSQFRADPLDKLI